MFIKSSRRICLTFLSAQPSHQRHIICLFDELEKTDIDILDIFRLPDDRITQPLLCGHCNYKTRRIMQLIS